MNEKDNIKDLFQEQLGNLESPVNPELWQSIASQVGMTATTSTVTATGISLAAKLAIGISAASVIAVGVFFITKDTSTPSSTTNRTALVESKKPFTETSEVETSKQNDAVKKLEVQPTHQLATTQNSTKVNSNFVEEVRNTPTSSDDLLLDNKTYISTPNPNIMEKKSATTASENKVVAQEPAPKKTENKTNEVVNKNTASNTVAKEAQPTFELITLPNIYSLNANGYFSIDYKGEYNDFQFTLMDENSNVIFKSAQPDFKWRGTDSFNNVIQPGKYIYIITVKDVNGKAINKFSTLTVIN